MKSTRYSYPILTKIEFSRQFSENPQISYFMKIRPVGAELFYAERRTDGWTSVTKLAVAFRNFVKASKNYSCRLQ